MNNLIVIFLGLLGAILGSFISVATQRLAAGDSLGGRSHCAHCARQLRWWELVPILSHFALRGRCKSCGQKIGLRSLVIEILGLVIGATAGWFVPVPLCVWIAAFGWLMLCLAILDYEHFWLPDKIVYAVLLLGLVEALVSDSDMFVARLVGCLAGFLSLEALRQLYFRARGQHGMGGGDPKLFAAIGAWSGWQLLPFVILFASLTGLCWILLNRMRGELMEAHVVLPFGTYLALAGYCTLLFSVT